MKETLLRWRGAGVYNREIQFTGAPEILRDILDYNDIWLLETQEEGWSYCDSTYGIELYEGSDGQLILELWNYETEEYVEKCSFTATYTAEETYDLNIAGHTGNPAITLPMCWEMERFPTTQLHKP